jgi:HAD superfamily hydrolase (TIGR01484 family)
MRRMRFIAFACDYDETLACDGRVAAVGVLALKRLAASGRKLVLVTGRQLEDLLAVFPEGHLFDRIVAENGGVLYRPATREKRALGKRPPERFVDALSERRVSPLSVGEVIVATNEPQQEVVMEAIRDLGLELQLIFNKGAVMVLPSGIDKGTGLSQALRELGVSTRNCVAIGDAENDHAFLSISECSAAVSNALPTLKERADIVTSNEATAGVIELIDQLLADDLRRYDERLSRR